MFLPAGSPPQYQPRLAVGRSVPLVTSSTVPFVNGRAETLIGPDRAGQSWHVTRMVTVAGNPDETILLYVYRSAENPSNMIDSSADGSQSTSETDYTLLEGERVLFVWTGGTGVATINITGEINY